MRQGLHGGHVLEHRRPRVLGFAGSDGRRAFGGSDGRHDLARLHRVARLQRLEGGHPAVAGRRDGGLHLHRAHDEQRLAGGDLFAVRRAHFQDRTGHRAGDGSLAGFDGEFRGGRLRRRLRPRPAGDGEAHHGRLLPQQGHRAVGGRDAGVGREQVGVLLQQRGPGVAGADGGVGEDRLELVEVRGESADVELRNGSPHAFHGGGEGRGAGTERRRTRGRHLGEQGVELGRRRVADIAAAVDSHAGAGGFLICAERSGAAGDHPGLDGETPRLSDRRLVAEAQGIEGGAGGDLELRLHEVEARDLLGHRVLDLDAGVALDEEVLAGLGDDKELDRAGVHVGGRLHQPDRVGEEPRAQIAVQAGRGGRLDHLLVAELDRAVPLVQVDGVAVRVGEDLDLDVPWTLDQLLDEHRTVAEGRLGLATAALEGLGHRIPGPHRAHAAAAAAGCRLQHDGIAEQIAEFARFVRRRDRSVAAGNDRDI